MALQLHLPLLIACLHGRTLLTVAVADMVRRGAGMLLLQSPLEVLLVSLVINELHVLVAENLLLTLMHGLFLVCDLTCSGIVSLNDLLLGHLLIHAVSAHA